MEIAEGQQERIRGCFAKGIPLEAGKGTNIRAYYLGEVTRADCAELTHAVDEQDEKIAERRQKQIFGHSAKQEELKAEKETEY